MGVAVLTSHVKNDVINETEEKKRRDLHQRRRGRKRKGERRLRVRRTCMRRVQLLLLGRTMDTTLYGTNIPP